MDAQTFKIRDAVRRRGVVARSSNYALYADLSRRPMETLATFADTWRFTP